MRRTFVLIARLPPDGIDQFRAYEREVLPLLADHGGRLDRRLVSADRQTELHLVSFPSEEAFEAYREDPRRADRAGRLVESGASTELLELTDRPVNVLALVPDLMDRSKMSATAVAPVRFVGSVKALAERVRDDAVDLVIVDLSRPDVLDVLPDIVAAAGRVIAFGSHVDTEVLAAARGAGCEVLPRSAFFSRLPDLLG